jgi:hypothetical protein
MPKKRVREEYIKNYSLNQYRGHDTASGALLRTNLTVQTAFVEARGTLLLLFSLTLFSFCKRLIAFIIFLQCNLKNKLTIYLFLLLCALVQYLMIDFFSLFINLLN